jgi:hypothetical protein
LGSCMRASAAPKTTLNTQKFKPSVCVDCCRWNCVVTSLYEGVFLLTFRLYRPLVPSYHLNAISTPGDDTDR